MLRSARRARLEAWSQVPLHPLAVWQHYVCSHASRRPLRGLLRERGLDGLLVAGFRAREMYETYISDDYNEGCVIFPLEGDPVVITWAHLRIMRARWSAERGTALWVADYRVATSGA